MPHPCQPVELIKHCIVCIAPIKKEGVLRVCDECLAEHTYMAVRDTCPYVTQTEGESDDD